MMKSRISMTLAACLAALVAGADAADSRTARWPTEKAWQWYNARPWLVGCNFLPSTAVNDVEMWRKETFDATTIDRELGWAKQLGFNTVRVFLNFVVWREDAAGLKERFAEFLKIADRHGISVMPILLDDCNFAGRVAAAGKQPDPVPGVHNSQWVSSPPLAMVTQRSTWPPLEQYVKDLVGTFRQDRRIVVWDLYNEPGNGMGARSQPLMEAAFRLGSRKEADPAAHDRRVERFQQPLLPAHDGAFGRRVVSWLRSCCGNRGKAEDLRDPRTPRSLHRMAGAPRRQYV